MAGVRYAVRSEEHGQRLTGLDLVAKSHQHLKTGREIQLVPQLLTASSHGNYGLPQQLRVHGTNVT